MYLYSELGFLERGKFSAALDTLRMGWKGALTAIAEEFEKTSKATTWLRVFQGEIEC